VLRLLYLARSPASESHLGEEARFPVVEVQCHHCGQVHRIPRDIFDDRDKIDLPCPSCGKSFQVVNPKPDTFRPETTRKKLSPVTAEVSPEGLPLRLPDHQELSLKIVEGEEKGTVYRLEKPRITLGRTNADVNIPDQAASRVHCVLEVSDEGVLLRDLSSTNGTLINDKPIRTAALSSGSTFRIGQHIFELLIAPKT